MADDRDTGCETKQDRNAAALQAEDQSGERIRHSGRRRQSIPECAPQRRSERKHDQSARDYDDLLAMNLRSCG
ncbi:MAG: hypothetical protein ABSE20_20670 [Acetobacteraceae bacterium]|jgi:hypothetical protein